MPVDDEVDRQDRRIRRYLRPVMMKVVVGGGSCWKME